MHLKHIAPGIFSITLISMLAACSTVKNPTATYNLQRFVVPEVAAQSWRPAIYAGVAQTHKVVLPVHNSQQPNFSCNNQTKCKNEEPIFSMLALSVAPGVVFHYNTALRRVSATWQYAGEYAGQAKAGNFSQALVLGYGLFKDSGNFGDASEIADANPTLSWDQSTHSMDIGWVAGYRLNDNWLLYGGPFVLKQDVDLSSRFMASGDGYETIHAKQNFKGTQVGANIATQYRLSRRTTVNLELVSAKYRMEQSQKTNTQLNLMLGIHF